MGSEVQPAKDEVQKVSLFRSLYDWASGTSSRSNTSAQDEVENIPCKYRLEDTTSATLELPDGRRLGYAQYGQPGGKAVFYLHGLPGCRLEALPFDETAIRLGASVIAVDRPGVGLSSPQPQRTILDHVQDLEHLAEHLKLESYGVLGISGGGPYALACAAKMSADRLKAVTIVCGLGPSDIGNRGMNWQNYLGFTFFWPYIPRFPAWYLQHGVADKFHLSDGERLKLHKNKNAGSIKKAHPKDAEVMRNTDESRLYLWWIRQAFKQGTEGTKVDGHLLSMDLGFQFQNIRGDLPVRLWYGSLDTLVPARHGQVIADRLGSNAKLVIEEETHGSLVVNGREKMLADLVSLL